jgi:hypothetical protein
MHLATFTAIIPVKRKTENYMLTTRTTKFYLLPNGEGGWNRVNNSIQLHWSVFHNIYISK